MSFTLVTISCSVISFYFGIKQLQYKTNTIPVYICYYWFNSWLLLFLILYSCYLLFLIVILVILILDSYTRVYLLFFIWCGYIFPSINEPDIGITTIYYNILVISFISEEVFAEYIGIQWKCEIFVPITVIFLQFFQ